MTYVISDIHGEYDKYLKMLDTIFFTKDDFLYVIGDCADRYKGGVTIWKDIMSRDNVMLIRGNHEQMCIDTLGWHPKPFAKNLWKSNGGGVTYRELVYKCTPKEKVEIIKFLENTPIDCRVVVNNREFYLVHGFPGESLDDMIWGRPEITSSVPFYFKQENITVIVGHTPTPFITQNWTDPFSIFYGDGFIDIDCGCGNETNKRRLACIRLEDMREYYV